MNISSASTFKQKLRLIGFCVPDHRSSSIEIISPELTAKVIALMAKPIRSNDHFGPCLWLMSEVMSSKIAISSGSRFAGF